MKAREALTAHVLHEQTTALPEPFRALCCLSSFMHLHGGTLCSRWGCVLPQPCVRQGLKPATDTSAQREHAVRDDGGERCRKRPL